MKKSVRTAALKAVLNAADAKIAAAAAVLYDFFLMASRYL